VVQLMGLYYRQSVLSSVTIYPRKVFFELGELG